MTIKGWVGLSDGDLVTYRTGSPDCNGLGRSAEFYTRRNDAQMIYADVRRATLTIEEPKKRAAARAKGKT